MRHICLVLVLVFQGYSEEYLLKFAQNTPHTTYYYVMSKVDANLVLPEQIRSYQEDVAGVLRDQYFLEADASGFNAHRLFTVEEYLLNGKKVDIPEYLSSLLDYNYLVHQNRGVVKKSINPDFDPLDVMEMNLVLPEKKIKIGSQWASEYWASLPIAGSDRIKLEGNWQLKEVNGDVATISGRFQAKVAATKAMPYAGLLRFMAQHMFSLSKGVILEGKQSLDFRYESRTELARLYSKEVSDGTRLGYRLKFMADIRPMTEAAAVLRIPAEYAPVYAPMDDTE
ncbi:MAG: hypothetical protein H3C47_01795 [Candidatus Cloacimonetes bacterium]|nr:hypothetical protein [Candidatus Cloacimonadota bacterium]